MLLTGKLKVPIVMSKKIIAKLLMEKRIKEDAQVNKFFNLLNS